MSDDRIPPFKAGVIRHVPTGRWHLVFEMLATGERRIAPSPTFATKAEAVAMLDRLVQDSGSPYEIIQ